MATSKKIVVVTGAGTSANVPNIKHAGLHNYGMEYKDMHSIPKPGQLPVWMKAHAAFADFVADTEPSAFYEWIKKWIVAGRVAFYMTQNVDGMEKKAGIESMLQEKLEYTHGNYFHSACWANPSHREALSDTILAKWRLGEPYLCGICTKNIEGRTKLGLRGENSVGRDGNIS